MALRPPSPDSWSQEILASAREMFNGTLWVYKPGNATGDYDPRKDEPVMGPRLLVLGPRPARAQHIRLPVESNDGLGWTARRRYRFQTEILEDDPLITKGLIVEFRGGNDPALESTVFQVVAAMNSSHAALRTIECVTEGAA